LLVRASPDRVQELFKAWEEGDGKQESPVGNSMGPEARYMYCVHVDRETLENVVVRAPQPPWYDMRGVRYVNLVDGMRTPNVKGEEEEGEGEEGKEEKEEPEDVGNLRVCIDGLVLAIYVALNPRRMYYCGYQKLRFIWLY
jgi:hypothetical protein